MASRTEMTEKGFKSEVWDENSILDTLQHELMELKDKIESARNKGDFGTYKNLILAFKEVVHLVHEEEEKVKWVDMYSHYYEGNESIKGENEYVATWKQNFKGDITEHRIFKVEKEIKRSEYILLKSNEVIIDCSDTDEYKSVNFSLPKSISKINKDKIKVMTYIGQNKYEDDEIPFWVGCYGEIDNGFLNIKAISQVKNAKTEKIYSKDVCVRYEILLIND